MDCLFCKIINGEIPSEKLYEDDKVYVFKDIDPQAPVHFLVITKEHIDSANEIEEENKYLMGHAMYVAAKVAMEQGVAETGYRIVNNCGEDGGQTVNHIHFHVLGKRSLQWPPG